MTEEKCVNVVGAGLAGLSCAVTLAQQGVYCNLISAQPSERAASVLAEGGINAALDTMGENDTPAEHFADTMKGGCYLEAESAVRNLTDHAPGVVLWLKALGAPLLQKDGRLVLRNFGGQKKKRTAHAKASTGKIIMTALIDEARKYEARGLIRRYPHHVLTHLDVRDNVLCSVTVRDTYTEKAYRFSGVTVLCTGGLNGFFEGMTTGTTANTGDAAAAAFAAGVTFANLEMIQFHPTTVDIAGKRMLVSEAARGEGGRLFILRHGKPWYFMEEKYPAAGNLAPRDVISREMVFVRKDTACEGEVCLDLTALPDDVWQNKLSDLRAEILSYQHIDPKTTPVPVSPGIHFFMGGVRVSDRHETNVKGLFAAGEAACKYHGANRLGGNSMLGAVFGGQTAGRTAAGIAGPVSITAAENDPFAGSDPACRAQMSNILFDALGIVRDAEGLETANKKLTLLYREAAPSPTDRDRVRLGLAMVRSALAREESRGAHFRSDFPETKEEFRRLTSAYRDGETISIRFVPAGEGGRTG